MLAVAAVYSHIVALVYGAGHPEQHHGGEEQAHAPPPNCAPSSILCTHFFAAAAVADRLVVMDFGRQMDVLH